MRRLLLLFSAIHLTVVAIGQQSDNVIIGNKLTLYSHVLKEERRILVYTPAFTSQAVVKDAKYPVLYLLDGDVHFFSTVGIIQQLSQANGNGVLPEMIVVAVENTNRSRDLTPASETSGNLAKANPFVRFLSSELIPFVDSVYNAAPYKVLVGHSLGGLTAIDMLANFPDVFNSYIAIDPSMWYNNERYLRNAITQLSKNVLKGKRLFIGTANTLPKGVTFDELKTDKNPGSQHMRSIFKLDEFLKSSGTGLKYAQKYYELEKHNSVPLLSEYDGLRFIFNYYALDIPDALFSDSSSAIAGKLKDHYRIVSAEMGYTVGAPESLVNYLGYDALSKKQYNRSEALFKLNVENYPESISSLQAFADLCLAKADTAAAIAYYQKALRINGDPVTSARLRAITKQGAYALAEEELKKYAGTYMLEAFRIDMVLEIRGGKLWAKVPGQADTEFVPLLKDVFTVRGKAGYTISFEMKADKPVSFISVQPNGTFKAVRK